MKSMNSVFLENQKKISGGNSQASGGNFRVNGGNPRQPFLRS